MRIIIITSSSNRSGGTRQAMYQAAALAELGHEVFFCLPAKGSLWELAPPNMPQNLQWIALPEGCERSEVEKLLPQDSTPTIVHAFHNRAVKRLAWWGLQWQWQDWWQSKNCKAEMADINAQNCKADLNSPTGKTIPKANCKRKLVCLSHRGVIYRPGNPLPYLSPGLRAVLVNSMACGHKLGWHCPPSKIKHVPNGVPSQRITPSLSPAEARELYQISTGDPVFMHVGGNNPAKGLDTLLEAFALAKLPTARLLLIGPDQAKWEALCTKLGLKLGSNCPVQFLGRLENVANCLQLADVFIFASRDMDSAPNTLLEAMHLGLPIIATKVGGVPEIAQDNGILVPANDPAALATALKQMAANPELRQIFAKKSLELAKNYTMQKRCCALEAIYTQLLAD